MDKIVSVQVISVGDGRQFLWVVLDNGEVWAGNKLFDESIESMEMIEVSGSILKSIESNRK